MKVLDLWYFAIEAETLIRGMKDPAFRRRAIKGLAKVRERNTSDGPFPKLVCELEWVAGHQRPAPGDLPLGRSHPRRGLSGSQAVLRPVP